jgi:Lrp/AsnC family transcriptional regulator for asnA, asnC and gidA
LIENNILKIVAVSDPFTLGFSVVGNIKINVDIELAEHVGRELSKLKEIWYVGQMTGVADFDVEFIVQSFQEFHELVLKKIQKINGVIRTETSFVLKHFKHSYDWGTPKN